MRTTQTIGGLIALLAIGGVAAGCGAAKQIPSAAVPPSAPIAPRPTPAQIAFLAPAKGASVGSTVVARVKVSGRGRVRFVLDGGRPRIAAGSAITYRHLAPGQHQLVAQLLASPELRPAVSATTRFHVRHAHTPGPSPTASTQAPIATTPAPIATKPAPAASTPAPPAPAAPTVAPPAPKPKPRPAPAPPTHAGGGIPQGGGGDGDGDNNGGPSDGDGNV